MAKKVSDIMSRRLEVIHKDTTLGEASKLMKEKSIRHLPVVERTNNQLLGMVSDRDLKKMISPFIGSQRETAQDKATLGIEVGRVMASKLVTASPDDEVKVVAEKMVLKKYGAIPVVDETGRLVGIISTIDCLKLLVSML